MSEEWICGRRAVAEVFAAGRRKVHQLIIEPGPSSGALENIVDAAELAGVGVESAERDQFLRLGLRDAQRVAVRVDAFAFRHQEQLPVAGADGSANSLLVVLDHLVDPQNVGAILRTAEAAGCLAVCMPSKRSVGITPAVVRASAGAVEHLPVFRIGNVAQLIGWLQDNGYWTVALDGDGEQSWSDVDYRGHIALVVGAEGKGVQRLVRKKCDHRVALPLRGRVGSLNASAAFAAVTYEVVRQQRS